MHSLVHLPLIGVTLWWIAAPGLPLHRPKLELEALDCRAPKGISQSEIKSLYAHSEKTKEHKSRNVHLLQFDQTRIMSAMTCNMRKTRVLAYCGSFSH